MSLADLSHLNVRCRPLDHWTGSLTPDHKRERAKFKKSWSTVVEDLARELRQISATEIILLLAVGESDIVVDGTRPKANARARHPGVVLVFQTKAHGPMRMQCDHFGDWMSNLQAIAVGLHDRRRLERYGIIKSGEMYSSWRQLPGPAPAESTMTVEQAATVLSDNSGYEAGVILQSHDTFTVAWRTAVRKHHPDQGGDEARFKRVMEAKRIIENQVYGVKS